MNDLIQQKKIIILCVDIENLFNNMNINTKKIYIKAVNDFLSYSEIGINQIQNITYNDIIKYIEYLKTKYSNSTVNLKLSALKSLFRKLSIIIPGYKNQFEILKGLNIKTNFSTIKSIDRDLILKTIEVNDILKYFTDRLLKTSNKRTILTSKRNALIITLLYKHGLRISELLNIKLSDIHKQNDNLYLINITGKGHKERQIKINNNLYNQIIDLLNTYSNNQTDYIFQTLHGKNIDRIFITKEIKRIAKRILNKNISSHSLRHSFATNLYKITGNIKGISQYIGHSTIKTTIDMYIHNDLTAYELELI